MRTSKLLMLLMAAVFGTALIGCQRDAGADRSKQSAPAAANPQEVQPGMPGGKEGTAAAPGSPMQPGSPPVEQPGEKKSSEPPKPQG